MDLGVLRKSSLIRSSARVQRNASPRSNPIHQIEGLLLLSSGRDPKGFAKPFGSEITQVQINLKNSDSTSRNVIPPSNFSKTLPSLPTKKSHGSVWRSHSNMASAGANV